MTLDQKTRELVAVGASIAGNCLPCLEYHFKQCLELNIPITDIKEAIEMAKKVKEAPAKKIDELANNLLRQNNI